MELEMFIKWLYCIKLCAGPIWLRQIARCVWNEYYIFI